MLDQSTKLINFPSKDNSFSWQQLLQWTRETNEKVFLIKTTITWKYFVSTKKIFFKTRTIKPTEIIILSSPSIPKYWEKKRMKIYWKLSAKNPLKHETHSRLTVNGEKNGNPVLAIGVTKFWRCCGPREGRVLYKFTVWN